MLDVLDDVGLPQVVDADPSESREMTSDGGGLPCCKNREEPTREEMNMAGEDFWDGLTWFTRSAGTTRDEVEIEPVHEKDHNLVLYFTLEQREEDHSLEHLVRVGDGFPKPGSVLLLDEAFDGRGLAELGVDRVQEVDQVRVWGGRCCPGDIKIKIVIFSSLSLSSLSCYFIKIVTLYF